MQLFNPMSVISPERGFCESVKSGSFHLEWLGGFTLFVQPSLKDALWADWLSVSDGITYDREFVGDVSMLKVLYHQTLS